MREAQDGADQARQFFWKPQSSEERKARLDEPLPEYGVDVSLDSANERSCVISGASGPHILGDPALCDVRFFD